MFGVVLLCIRHKNFAVEISDAKRCITGWKIRIRETVRINLLKILIVGFDLAGVKIRDIQKIVTVGDAERCTFVNGAVNAVVRAVIDGDDRVRPVQCGIPTRKWNHLH